MRRYPSPAVHFLELERSYAPDGKTYSHRYVPPGADGDMMNPQIIFNLMFWPAGHTQPWGRPGQLEHHWLHEEVFFLAGSMNYDNVYTVSAPGYLNHPPFWAHPTNHWSVKEDGQLSMLLRSCLPPLVQLTEVPTEWDQQLVFAPATRSVGVRNLQLDDIPWSRLIARDGRDTGTDAKRMSEDRDDGWTAWLMRVPADWRSAGPRITAEGGDEIYVIDGDLTLDRADSATLRESGYVCDVDTINEGDGYLSSTAGATFLRWTRNGDQVWRVAPQD